MRVYLKSATEHLNKLKILYNDSKSHIRKILPANLVTSSTKPSISFQKSENLVANKFVNVRHWYEEFTGLDEVKAAQDRVLEAEIKFIAAQETRRLTNNKLTLIQNRLREIYSELDKTKRGEERYVFLITQEHAILKEERLLANEFQQFEREEREHFSILSSALKDSHEKERLQAEKTKYWSIIGSILGTVIGIIGSSVNNQFRMRELRRLLSEAVTQQEKVDPIVANQLQQILLKLNDTPSSQLVASSQQQEADSHGHDQEAIMSLVQQQQEYQRRIAYGLAAVAASVILIFCKTFATS